MHHAVVLKVHCGTHRVLSVLLSENKRILREKPSISFISSKVRMMYKSGRLLDVP